MIVENFGHQEDLAWIGVSFVLGQALILPMCVPECPVCPSLSAEYHVVGSLSACLT